MIEALLSSENRMTYNGPEILLLGFETSNGVHGYFKDERYGTEPSFISADSTTRQVATNSGLGNYSLLNQKIKAYAVYDVGSNFAIGTSDFTIECWVNYGTELDNDYIVDLGVNKGLMRILNGSLNFYDGANSLTHQIKPTVSAWNHLAAVRNNGITHLYVNGVKSTSSLTSAINYDSQLITFLNYGGRGSYSYIGYIDEFRITKGVALYTSDFTPIMEPFPR